VPAPCTYHVSSARREDLLSESLLSEGPVPVILHPLNGQVFYFDEALEDSVQRIPVLIAAPADQPLSVAFDGGPPEPAAARFTIPAFRGRHTIRVSTRSGEAVVSFIVK
jgi:hypothetical protein